MAGETDIGSIVGYLKMDISDWMANAARAKAKGDELSKNSPRIDIHVDVAAAIAALQAVKTEEDRVSDSNSKLQQSSKDAAGPGGLGLIAQAVIALGPAVGPLAGAAAGAAGAFALLGASGELAIKGISQQISAGTVAGVQYAAGVASLQSYLTKLEATAAGGLLAPFNAALGDAASLMPALNGDVALFAQDAGEIADHVLVGLIDGFHTLTPLLQFVANGLEHGSEEFEQWSSSTGGVVKFAAYAQSVLPQVVATLSDLAQTAVRLGTAFSSSGVTVLSVLDDMAKLINALPLPVLQALAIAVEAGFVAWKLYTGLTFVTTFYDKIATKIAANNAAMATNRGVLADSAAAQRALAAAQVEATAATNDVAVADARAAEAAAALTDATLTVGEASDVGAQAALTYSLALQGQVDASTIATAATERLQAAEAAVAEQATVTAVAVDTAFGPIGLIAGAAAAALVLFGTSNAKSQQATQANAAAIQALTSALEASNGAITDSIRSSVAKSLADSGAAKDAQALGLQVSTVTDAALGNADAQNTVKAAILAATQAWISQTDATGNAANSSGVAASAADDLQGKLKTTTSQFSAAKQQADLYNLAMGISADATSQAAQSTAANTAALAASADRYGITVAQAQNLLGVLGLTSGAMAGVGVTSQQVTTDMAFLANAESRANASATGLIAAMNTYAQSAGTAADKAQLISAYLIASQGDALAYGAAISGAYNAVRQLTGGFTDEAAAVKKGTEAFGDSERAAIDFTTSQGKVTSASIDYTKVGAGPLIQALQGMQTAAAAAASATYQHEVATKDAGTAAADAAAIFESETNGALIANAKQLGLTGDQATALANAYFAMPPDVTTAVQSIGLSDINTTLQQLGKQLSYLTGVPWTVNVGVQFALNNNVGQLVHDAVNSIPNVTVTPVLPANAGHRAFGGLITGPGSGTSDSIPTWLSAGEFVMPADKTAMYGSVLDAMRSDTFQSIAAPGASLHGVTIPGPTRSVVTHTASVAAPSNAALESEIRGLRADLAQIAANPVPPIVTLDGRRLTTRVNEINLQKARAK